MMFGRPIRFVSSWRLFWLTAFLTLSVASCRDDGGRPASGSDGVEPPRSEWPDVRNIAFTPDQIARSPSSVQFGSIRDVQIDSKGRIYAGDGRALRVHVLSPTADPIRTIGGEGMGPGEFQHVTGLQILPGDSLLVYDIRLQRISVFPSGASAPARTTTIRTPVAASFPHWVTSVENQGERFLLAAFERTFMPSDPVETDSARKTVLAKLSPDGQVLDDSLLVYPAARPFTLRLPEGGIVIQTNPFSRRGAVAVSREGLFYGLNDAVTFEFRDFGGGLLHEFGYAYKNARVTEDDLDSLISDVEQERMHPVIRSSAPDAWPAWNTILATDRGDLLVGLITESGEPSEWARFDPEGKYIGSFLLPESVTLYDAAGDTVYGVHRGPLDIPDVRVYTLRRRN